MAARYKAKIETPHGLRTCFEVRVPRGGKKDLVARFGGIPLLRNKNRVIADSVQVQTPLPRKELIHRLRTRRCELCGQHGTVAVHQIARLARLGAPGPGWPAWAALMTRKRRKTLVVCQPCHEVIHANPVTHAA
jgi:AI2M/AI1M-like, HNH endonuclease